MKPEQPLRFAIFGNIYQPKKSMAIQKILAFLSERGAKVYMEEAYHRFLTDEQQITVHADDVFSGSQFEADYVISMGGDGTFLSAASRVARKCTPIIGVNMGRLGFLASIAPDTVEEALRDIFDGCYRIEELRTIQVEADGQLLGHSPYALNDIAVLKRDNASMISIRAYVGGEYLVTYQADGLVVSTPTGSTAYSLSNGGPIIVPQAGVLCLTPVAPHSLNVRPLVIPDDAEISLTVESRSHQFLVAIDGRSEKCAEGTVLSIRKTDFPVRVVKRHDHTYFHTLRDKMMWGRSYIERI